MTRNRKSWKKKKLNHIEEVDDGGMQEEHPPSNLHLHHQDVDIRFQFSVSTKDPTENLSAWISVPRLLILEG